MAGFWPALFLAVTLLPAPLLAEPDFVHCYDFGCKTTRELHYEARHWERIRSILSSGTVDAGSERQAIRKAVAEMERISGDLAGTHLDKAGNYPGYDLARQMDCIDESTNTYQYLVALEQLGLLKWHRAGLKKRRIVWFTTHWTATIEEIASGSVYAVDSWYRDNGEPPYIQALDDWFKKREFTSELNPELTLAEQW